MVIGDFMKPFFSAKLFLFKFTIESKLLRCVIERKFPTDDHGQMISEKWTLSRQEIRSRAAVTGDVMAADVSPPPADAALPVGLQARPQDVDRGHKMDIWI